MDLNPELHLTWRRWLGPGFAGRAVLCVAKAASLGASARITKVTKRGDERLE
jgi:hypothetical protein